MQSFHIIALHTPQYRPEIDERNLYRCSEKLLDVIMSSPDQYDDKKLLPSLSGEKYGETLKLHYMKNTIITIATV